MDSSSAVTPTTATSATPATTSDDAVSATMGRGFEKMVWQTAAGCVLGAMAGIVLSRGGGAGSGARKALAGLGAGVGLGSAWTRTSMDLEELLNSKKE